MGQGWLTRAWTWPTLALVVLVFGVGLGRASDGDDLPALIERQRQRLEDQRRQLERLRQQITQLEDQRQQGGQPPADDPPAPDPGAVKKVVGDYLKDNPGAGMPPGVQTG